MRRARCKILGDPPRCGLGWPLATARLNSDVAGEDAGQAEGLGAFPVVKRGERRGDLFRLAARHASYCSLSAFSGLALIRAFIFFLPVFLIFGHAE